MARVAHFDGRSLNGQLGHQLRLRALHLLRQQRSLHHALTEAARKLHIYLLAICDADDADQMLVTVAISGRARDFVDEYVASNVRRMPLFSSISPHMRIQTLGQLRAWHDCKYVISVLRPFLYLGHFCT